MVRFKENLGKRGGPKNKGFVWLTDGVINIKYSPKMQKVESVQDFLVSNPSFRVGMIDTKPAVTCPHCGVSGRKSAMVLNHFDNCGIKRTFKIEPIECPHCGKVGAGDSMKRWHFDNCKERKNVS